MKFRKKPVVIEAIQLGRSPRSLSDVLEFIGSTKPYAVQDEENDTHSIVIPTFVDGEIIVSVGDWVIREDGAVATCKPNIFAAIYEAVDADAAPASPAAKAVELDAPDTKRMDWLEQRIVHVREHARWGAREVLAAHSECDEEDDGITPSNLRAAIDAAMSAQADAHTGDTK